MSLGRVYWLRLEGWWVLERRRGGGQEVDEELWLSRLFVAYKAQTPTPYARRDAREFMSACVCVWVWAWMCACEIAVLDYCVVSSPFDDRSNAAHHPKTHTKPHTQDSTTPSAWPSTSTTSSSSSSPPVASALP